MSSHSDQFEAIQPEDTTETGEAVANTIDKRAREHTHKRRLEARAHVRELLAAAEAAFAGETDNDPDDVLDELQAALADDPDLRDVLAPTFDDLDAQDKLSYRRFAGLRERQRAGEDVRLPLKQEFTTYVRVSIALEHIHAATDRTSYAPVTLEKLDVPGARSPVEGDVTPIGRVRVGAGSTQRLEDRATVIPHRDCEHILVVANPREGKDALISRICGNLKDEHGYKWISLHDDGRFETNMIAVPNDEDPIIRSLESFNQAPKGYPTKVYVPAVGLPDELAANHVPFTIGVDALTPEIIAQLSGVNPEASTERRIKHALREVLDGAGSVDELIRLLEKYADDTTAEITVTELRDQDELEDEEVESETRSYQMGEDKVLRDCAHSLMMLASEGLLRNRGAETNLDMVAVIEDQAHAAVLNCNYLPEGDEHLKFLVENLWLRLIHRARDKHPGIPRVALEMREIKELAPSTLERTKYSKIVKALRQTLFFISSQGGSRRILMIGSTQYIRDVYKPIRGNMPIKVLLKMGEEKIRTLESAGFNFSAEEYNQLKSFDTGWGMLLMPEGKTYPINWSGPRNGLGLGDLEWHHRYALAMGFRVQRRDVGPDGWEHDAEMYFDQEGSRQLAPPARHEWYLLPADVEPVATVDDVDRLPEDVLERVLSRRQPYPLDQDLRPQPVDLSTEQRQLQLVSTAEAEERASNEVFQKFDVTGVLRDWTRRQEATVGKFVRILESIQNNEVTSYDHLAEVSGVSLASIKQYLSDEERLANCTVKESGSYHLTPIGRQALEIPWPAVFDDLD